MRNRSISIILGILIPILISSCNSITQPMVQKSLEKVDLTCDEMKTFRSSKYNYSINYPKSWSAIELPNGNHGDKEVIALFVSSNYMLPEAEIAYKRKPGINNLPEVSDWGKNRITLIYSSGDIEMQPIQDISSGESKWQEITYQDISSTPKMLLKDVYIGREEDSIILTFKALETNYEMITKCFDQMINSFLPKR